MPSIEIEDDFQIPRPSCFIRGRRSSSCTFSFPPSPLVHGFSRKSFSYDKLPQQPLMLSIHKLDGSCFDVKVSTAATVAELKQAVESVFCHFPQKGPGKISWAHVWGQFCLCYDGQKLLTETDCIKHYGIKDGDQLHFVRHVSIKYNLAKGKSKKRSTSVKTQNITNQRTEGDLFLEGDDDYEDLENPKCQYMEVEDEDILGQHGCKLAQLLKGWFSYSRLPSTRKMKAEDSYHSSGFIDDFVSILRKLIRCCS